VKVEEAGGNIIMQKTFVSESVGYVAMFYDTEGNKIGLYSGK
jgi:predicted enzyme related to lactoylglutathione lyase